MTKSEAIAMYFNKWDVNSDDMVIANIGLAVKMAMPYFDRWHHYPNQDIMQQAILGLYEASKRFDKSKGVIFSTYATHYIRGYIKQVGRTKRDKIYNRHYRLNSRDVNYVLETYNDIDNEDQVNTLISCLNDRELKIINFRYGLNGCMTCSLDEIGKMMNLSRERIRQIEQIALEKMRNVNDGE